MGAIRDAIAAALADGTLTDAERRVLLRRIKARALRDSAPALPFTFTPGQFSITIETVEEVNDNLVVTLSASRLGVPIPLNNPFVFVNPPTHIEDPTGDLIRTSVGRDGVTRTRRYREAPLLAMRQAIIEAVRLQAQ